MSGSTQPSNPAIATAVILNWRRQKNLPSIVASLRMQTVTTRIVIWHNGTEAEAALDCDEWIRASRNHLCWPRWFVASQAPTEYVFCIDDDITLGDADVLADLISQHENNSTPGGVTGIEGVVLSPGCGYFPTHERPWTRAAVHDVTSPTSWHIGNPLEPTKVDIVKGRLILARTTDLNLPMQTPMSDFADDIAVCGTLARKRARPHLVAAMPKERVPDLPEKAGPMALSRSPDVAALRERARALYFSHI